MNIIHEFFTPVFLSVQSSVIFKGTQKLINDLSKALLVIAPAIAAIALIYMAIRRMLSGDEHEMAMWKNRQTGVMIAAVIAVAASALISLVTNYYQ